MKAKLAHCTDGVNSIGTPVCFCLQGGFALLVKPLATGRIIRVILSTAAGGTIFGRMALWLVLLSSFVNAKAADTNQVLLPPEPVTITNITGKVYKDVWLDHVTPDGVIYASLDKTSEGMIHYSDMTTNDLIKFRISPAMLGIAAARNAQRNRAEQAYQQAEVQAMMRRQPADLAQSNTVQNISGDPIDTWVNMKRALGKPAKGKAGLPQ